MDCEIVHAGRPIAYRLRLSARRRTVGLRVDEAGLTVHAPSRIGKRALEHLLLERADWILTKLGEWDARRLPAMRWQSGEIVTLRGEPLHLHVALGKRQLARFDPGFGALRVEVTDPGDFEAVAAAVLRAYKREALADFPPRIEMLASRLALPRPRLLLSNARTRWGSCNVRGEIRLNWRLVQAPPALIDYVAAHELAHLVEMNHGPQFWAVVGKLCPDYVQARNTLRQQGQQLHRIG